MNLPHQSGATRKSYLRRSEAARYIDSSYFPCAPRTLAKLATVGGGPKFRRVGRTVIYDPTDLDQWAASRVGPRVSSTSDFGRAA